MAAIPLSSWLVPAKLLSAEVPPARLSDRLESIPSLSQVFRGRELTLKTRRVCSGLDPIDGLIGGGVVRGRISEIIGSTGAGKTSLAMAFAATVTRVEAAAWIEAHDSLDPASMIAAGVEPARMLWASCGHAVSSRRHSSVAISEDDPAVSSGTKPWGRAQNAALATLKAAEWILAAGGFGLVVIDFGHAIRFIPQSAALRLARAAERSSAAIIVLARQQMCGTFAVLSLELSPCQVHFNRIASGANATFDGQAVEARVMRNKLGGTGGTAVWSTAVDRHSDLTLSSGSSRPSSAGCVSSEPERIVAEALG